jgi:hypothetical protein
MRIMVIVKMRISEASKGVHILNLHITLDHSLAPDIRNASALQWYDENSTLGEMPIPYRFA